MLRRNLLGGTAVAVSLTTARSPAANDFPTRPIKVVAPFGPGGSADITARLIGQRMQAQTGQPVVVENLPGGNAVIGVNAVRAAPADGYTLLLATNSTHAANPSLVKNLPYEPMRDLPLVALIGYLGIYLLVPTTSPFTTAQELVAAAKARPGKLSSGYFNSSSRIPGAALAKIANLDITEVPYRQIGQAMSDLIAKRLDFVFVDVVAGNAFLEGGQMRALGVTTPEPMPRRPEIPLLKAVYPEFDLTGMLGFAVRGGTPEPIKERLNTLINAAIDHPDVSRRLNDMGLVPKPLDLAGTTAYAQRDRENWERLIKLAGIEAE